MVIIKIEIFSKDELKIGTKWNLLTKSEKGEKYLKSLPLILFTLKLRVDEQKADKLHLVHFDEKPSFKMHDYLLASIWFPILFRVDL